MKLLRNHVAPWRRAAGGHIPMARLLHGACGMGTRAQRSGADRRMAARLFRTGERAYRLAIRVYPGPADAAPLVCVHGLTRNSGDFEPAGLTLSRFQPVIAIDIVGRGASDWLDCGGGYGYPRYLQDVASAMSALGVAECDWLGTSMGGIIGLFLASGRRRPIRRLILNDIGAEIPAEALRRIGAYVGRDDRFDDISELEARLREIHAPFGALTDAQWRRLAWNSARRRAEGGLGLAYDPAIAGPFLDAELTSDIDLWRVWDKIRRPTLVLRGIESDLLAESTLREMRTRGPGAVGRLAARVFENVGHAPALMNRGQIDVLSRWLAR